jgi:hypothetical protein
MLGIVVIAAVILVLLAVVFAGIGTADVNHVGSRR